MLLNKHVYKPIKLINFVLANWKIDVKNVLKTSLLAVKLDKLFGGGGEALFPWVGIPRIGGLTIMNRQEPIRP